MDDVVREFLVESQENLEQIEKGLVGLERSPGSPELLGAIFRGIHTIKGSSGFFSFGKMQALAHAGESLLSALRGGKLAMTREIGDAILGLVDVLRQVLREIEKTGKEGDADPGPLIARMARLQGSPRESREEAGRIGEEAGITVRRVRKDVEPGPAPMPSVSDSTVRIDVTTLDQFMDLVGELVLVRNHIVRSVEREKTSLQEAAQRLSVVTGELQDRVMKSRMQPIGVGWSKLPRLVRDLSANLGKQARLVMEGEGTEVDRSVLECIRDPLTHLVRNSVDHGIEPPQARVAAGKPAEGLILLRARQEGGHVLVEITDDGAGIQAERVALRAVQMGLLAPERSLRMDAKDVLGLIFRPGFSTAEQVTSVSGRGVGLDVVKTNVEKIGGVIEVQTDPGKRTTFTLKIPLTLAIIPSLIVRSTGQRYVIPEASVLELVRLRGERARRGIEMVQEAPVFRLRGRLIPLAFLDRELSDRPEGWVFGPPRDRIDIVVLQAYSRSFGLVVDDVVDTQEIVVKPLGAFVRGIRVFGGVSIMADGLPALILDVPRLAQKARIVAEQMRERDDLERPVEGPRAPSVAQGLVLCRSVDDGRIAVPLSRVVRLESLALSTVERVVPYEVVQYRGSVLPLIRMAEVLPERRRQPRVAPTERERVDVVVCREGSIQVGLVAEQILDIVEEAFHLTRAGCRDGVLGSAVIRGKVTELIDVGRIVEMGAPGLLDPGRDRGAEHGG